MSCAPYADIAAAPNTPGCLVSKTDAPLCLTSCGAPGWLFPLSQKDDDGCGCCPRSSCLSSLLASHGMAEACFWQRECVALSSGCAFYMCSWKFCRPTYFNIFNPIQFHIFQPVSPPCVPRMCTIHLPLRYTLRNSYSGFLLSYCLPSPLRPTQPSSRWIIDLL